MIDIDYAIAVQLLMGVAKYGSAKTYEILRQTWRDERPCPQQQPLDDIYIKYVEGKSLKHLHYYKYQDGQWILDTTKKQELKEAIMSLYNSEAATNFEDNFIALSLTIQESETEAQFLTNLFGNLKTEAQNNNNKKNLLANKTMAELMDIYDAISI
jgi:hypothetical protein